MTEHESQFVPVLPFDSDSSEFTRGFEVGNVWSILAHMPVPIGDSVSFQVHITNAEMMLRLGSVCNYRVSSNELDDEWMRIKFSNNEGGEAGV